MIGKADVEAFFVLKDDRFQPQEPAQGFWSRELLSGRTVVGLIGQEAELRHSVEGFRPVRLSVDMYRPATFRPLRIETEVIRTGSRLRLVEARLFDDQREITRAQILFLRESDTPPGETWSLPALSPPMPAILPVSGNLPERRFAEQRSISGSMTSAGPRQVWVRECRPMVEGRQHTPWSRLAAAADFASPWAHASDHGINYINCDVVLHVSRMPIGEWIGFETLLHSATGGIAVGTCRIFDEQGPIGQASTAALANAKRK